MIKTIPKLKFSEFVSLMAMLMSLTALSIDAMLPALGQIGSDLKVLKSNDSQYIISTLFVGLAFGQLFYGPFSDSNGRKPTVIIGISIFSIGCLVAMFATDLNTMLVGRFLQGIGLSAPRVVCIAIIRDLYHGERMAQVMSFVMTVFIIVPTIAPFMGQGVLFLSSWRAIFGVLLILGIITSVWLYKRQEETLPKEKQTPFRLKKLGLTLIEVFKNRTCIGYTLAAGFISSAFLGLLNSSQPILQVQFQLGEKFPVYFAIIALSVGSATFINSKLVMRFGMRKMVRVASVMIVMISLFFYGFIYLTNNLPSLTYFMVYLSATVFFIGILFGNLNSLAMEPLGHVAGLGSTVIGALSTLISVPFGSFIGQQYDGTVIPLVLGFTVFSFLSFISIQFASFSTEKIKK